MSNPVVGSDYTVEMISPESLVGATVTIEYKNPQLVMTEGVSPTNIDTESNVISYKMTNDKTSEGNWKIWAKIVNSSGDITYVNPAVSIRFDRKGQ